MFSTPAAITDEEVPGIAATGPKPPLLFEGDTLTVLIHALPVQSANGPHHIPPRLSGTISKPFASTSSGAVIMVQVWPFQCSATGVFSVGQPIHALDFDSTVALGPPYFTFGCGVDACDQRLPFHR